MRTRLFVIAGHCFFFAGVSLSIATSMYGHSLPRPDIKCVEGYMASCGLAMAAYVSALLDRANRETRVRRELEGQ